MQDQTQPVEQSQTAVQSQPDIRNQPIVRILKEATCPSLTGRSNLTYHVGCIGEAIQLRVFMNTGSGYFSQEWIPFASINDALGSLVCLTSSTLKPIFTGKSVNTAGFVMAVLKDLGLIQAVPGNQRSYQATGDEAFINEVRSLIASEVSLEIAEPKKAVKNTAKKVPNKKAQGKSADTVPQPSAPTIPPENADRKGPLKLKGHKQ